jgi:HEAT repeat protein
MKKKLVHISIGVLAGMVALAGGVWLLTRTLGNIHFPALFAGQTIPYWREQFYSRDAGASNAALATLNSQIIPGLKDTMVHDTYDSALRMSLINVLNGLPGVQIYYMQARERRTFAIRCLGDFGPAARAAVPDVIRALETDDPEIKIAAIFTLGKLQSDPDKVIPLLIRYLDDDRCDAAAAGALAEFGSLAKPAVPKLLPLLNARDDDDQAAAQAALLQIDPEAAAKAGVGPKHPKTRRDNGL